VRSPRSVAALAAAALLSACASAPLPRDFDAAEAQIVVLSGPTAIDVNGLPGGKAAGAGVGAGTGSGIGVVAGGLLCASTGPLMPLCLVTVLPTATAIGAVSGGVVGAIRTESLEAMGIKTRMLMRELADPTYGEQLVRELRERVGPAAASDAAPERPWTLEAGVVEIGTEGKSRFELRLVARVRLRQGTAPPLWEIAREVQSRNSLTTSQWLADDSRALRAVIERCIEQAAARLATELRRPSAAAAVAPSHSSDSTSCDDAPIEPLVTSS
jgi:hypothetical protein